MTPRLSVIIVTFNSGDLVLDTLRSIPQGVGEMSSEVLVVDNASADETPTRIIQEFPHVRMIANQDNRGFAAANNQGLALAKGHYFLLLNPDTIVHPGALANMVDFLDNNPDVGIVGPRMFDGKGHVALTAFPPFGALMMLWQFWGLSRLFPNHVFGHYRRDCQRANAPIDVGWLSGACLMLHRNVYTQIGGLDEIFFLFSEEPDFCDRALHEGWRVCFLPSACVTHYESSTVSRYTLTRTRHYRLSPLYYFSKRGRRGAVLTLKIGFGMELVLKLFLRLMQVMWNKDEELKSRICAYWIVLGEIWRYRYREQI